MKSQFITDLSLNRRQALKASLAFGGLSLAGAGKALAGGHAKSSGCLPRFGPRGPEPELAGPRRAEQISGRSDAHAGRRSKQTTHAAPTATGRCSTHNW